MTRQDTIAKLHDALATATAALQEPPPATTDEGPLLLTLAETARQLSCSRSSVFRLVRSGRLRVVHLTPGGCPRIRRADLDTLANQGGAR